MIFAAPRFVVVDDKAEHLKAIVDVFQTLGSPCIGVHYDPKKDLDASVFSGVRVLFMDLHLVDGAATTDQTRHYASIASLLETNLSATGGPYVLVIWTEHPQHKDELREYLDKALDPEKPHLFPLAVLALSKTSYIDTSSGATKDASALRKAVLESVEQNPQMAALLTWEADVLAAAGDTLAQLQALVPAASRSSATYPAALNDLLSLLAREAVGKKNVNADPRSALNHILVPLLADRILNAATSKDTKEIWKKAVTRAEDPKLSNADDAASALINGMLHVALPDAETIPPDAWGAIVEVPEKWLTDEGLSGFFDLNKNQLLTDVFKIKPEKFQDVGWFLIRIGAACDYAQKRAGPVPYVLTMAVPKDGRSKGMKLPEAEWTSPLLMQTETGPYYLSSNSRFILSLTQKTIKDLKVLGRLREQILMELIVHASSYTARPGIIRV
ncbi:hypothetical protein IVB22_10715 [Bradyrhizobium sp. 190]|uniref:hypothetical protein n=1 Tax=Bradyrhizobium sp. 190 TaxID=2782658 RepID=UPI001FF8D295|nr:hypothetical protein [Bradyrhizobium sp. 190]MCK1513036.1 hypothetical protein [Bradyrhizobium sp. 190]